MKTEPRHSPLLCLLSVASVVSLTGCHTFPKDSYAEGVKSTVNTPWGPSTFEARTLATGVAARNASAPDNVVPVLKPLPRPD